MPQGIGGLVCQSSSYSLQGLIDGEEVLEETTCRKLDFWLSYFHSNSRNCINLAQEAFHIRTNNISNPNSKISI